MDIEEFKKLVNLEVKYNEEKKYVEFNHSINLTFNLVQKTTEFFKFDNYVILNNCIFKIPKMEVLCDIENIFEGKCKFDFFHNLIEIECNQITDDEIRQIKDLLQCKSLTILGGGKGLRLKWCG